MTVNFLEKYQFFLTPLSPIHIGSGDDYIPTNFVIENNLMYLFEPYAANLTPMEKKELLELAQSSSLLGLQKFFKQRIVGFRNVSYRKLKVVDKIANEYKLKFGVDSKSGGQRLNQYIVSAAVINPSNQCVYVPSSSFKGALRTVVLDRLTPKPIPEVANIVSGKISNEKKLKRLSELSREHEKNTVGYFSSDIFRLLKIADFMPQQTPQSLVVYAERKPQTISGRYESIYYAQYRGFSASGVLQKVPVEGRNLQVHFGNNLPDKELVQNFSLKELIKLCNAYYRKIFDEEVNSYAAIINEKWVKDIRDLLENLKASLDEGDVMLVCLGQNTGALSKTIQSSRKIYNSQKKVFMQHSTSKWLAQQTVKNMKKAYDGWLPFGWALVEINPKEDNPHIRQWCLAHNDEEEARKRQAEQVERQQQAALEAQRLEQERLQKEQEEQARLATLAPADRLVQEVLAMLGSLQFDARKQVEAQNFYQALLEKLQNAVQTLSSEDQKKVAEQLSFKTLSESCKQLFSGKREKEIKGVLRQLRGEA